MNRNKREILIFLFCLLVVANVLWFGYRMINHAVDGEETPEENKVVAHTEVKKSTFYYDQLPGESQDDYEILRQGLMECNDSIRLEGCEGKSLAEVWEAVLMDNPGIFWANTYRYSEQRGESVSCEVMPSYCYTKAEIEERQTKIEEYTDKFVSGISRDASDYDKILYTYETIIEYTEYNLEAVNNQHIDSVILGKSSVCAGYAKTTKYLLNRLGVECIYVTGSAYNGEDEEAHAWTIVKCEDDYYFVDTTWGDPVYQQKTGGADDRQKNISYDYLCCNEAQLFKTHTLDMNYEYPSCTEMTWNYYVVNGRYFTEYNANEISELIKKDIEVGKQESEFRFSDDSVYASAKDDMINVQLKQGKALYDEMNGTEGIQCYYSEDEKNNKIIFYWE